MPSSPLEQFLDRARRHWTAWMIAEYAGLGLLAGSACVILLSPILLWRGEPGQGVATVFPSMGIVAGAIVGIRRRPPISQIARFADDRFQTADLLATAWSLRASNEPWHAGVLKMANARADNLSPAVLTPHRLGRRAWSGIAIVFITSITLGLFSVTTSPERVEASAPSAAPNAWAVREKNIAKSQDPSQRGNSSVREARAEATPDSRSMESANARSTEQKSVSQSNAAARGGQSQAASGSASALTNSPQIDLTKQRSASSANQSPDEGTIAHAGDGDAIHAHNDDGITSGQVSPDRPSDVAPWSSSSWPAARAAALNADREGTIPDGYRDLVRDYFQQ